MFVFINCENSRRKRKGNNVREKNVLTVCLIALCARYFFLLLSKWIYQKWDNLWMRVFIDVFDSVTATAASALYERTINKRSFVVRCILSIYFYNILIRTEWITTTNRVKIARPPILCCLCLSWFLVRHFKIVFSSPFESPYGDEMKKKAVTYLA